MKGNRSSRYGLCLGAALLALASHAQANGIYGNGYGARSMGMGGADVAWASDPLGAMAVNPAGLGFLTMPTLNLGATGGFVQGEFHKNGISDGTLDETPGALPEGAFGIPICNGPVVLGVSFVPEALLRAKWNYADPPGGLGGGTTSYGYQENRSQIIGLRSALGIAVKISPELSVGASVGATYNENRLVTPYVFQDLSPGPGGPSNAGVDGAKTLLNLKTSGYGWNAMAGIIYRPRPDLQFGLSYESETRITSTGTATGDVSTQFAAPIGTLPFAYDAQVKVVFPRQVRAGASWQINPQWRLALQIDWIDWADAFNNLPLTFTNGNNATVNSVLGSKFNENIPLNWSSEFVYRAGVEYNVTENWVLRGGYSYGSSPVDVSTMTPMTAAIMEHTFTAGVGYHWDRYRIDAAYQYDLPNTENIGASGLHSGEYSNTSIEVGSQRFALTTTVEF